MSLFVSHVHALAHHLLEIHLGAATQPLLLLLSTVRIGLDKSFSRAASGEPAPGWELTPREIEVAAWLTRAKSNPEIAVILGMAPRTVEKHMERILGKLGVENRTAAALLIATQDKRAGSS